MNFSFCLRRGRLALLLLALALFTPVSAQAAVRVFAAASLMPALSELAQNWQGLGEPAPIISFAASSVLAKQVMAGAPVDLFISADSAWMNTLQGRGHIQVQSRRNWLGNALVLVAPKQRAFVFNMKKNAPLATAFLGPLCTGETRTVPLGRYAQQALQSMGAWQSLRTRIVGTEDARTVLRFLASGECGAGLIYASDALRRKDLLVVAKIPAAWHSAIIYPMALTKSASDEARRFWHYLQSPEAHKVLVHQGFTVLALP